MTCVSRISDLHMWLFHPSGFETPLCSLVAPANAALASSSTAHSTAHRRPCASATRAGITMGIPPHVKCCGCCCSLHIGTAIGTGLYILLLLIVTVIFPAISEPEGVDEAKAFCAGTTDAYRQGNNENSALPFCTRRSEHPAPASASLPGAQATTCVTAPISAPIPTGTRWSRPRPRLTCAVGPSASCCSC